MFSGRETTLPQTNIPGAQGGGSSGYATPSQTLLPTLLKWQLLFEDPFSETLWLARAIPRSWLAPGKNVSISRSPSSYGRLGFSLAASTPGVVRASITLAPGFKWPPGGILLRLRSPEYPAKRISGVTVGGKPWVDFNATAETVRFGATTPGTGALLSIVAMFA